MPVSSKDIPKQPTGTPEPSQIDQFREKLLSHFMDAINQPQATPPQYQPPQINPRQAYALAQNPQAAPQMMQYAAGPAQARYQQQLDAFNQAINNQKTAETLGASLINAQTRNTGKGLKYIKSVVKDKNGVPRTKLDVFDPTTFSYIGTADLGEAPVQPGMTPYIDPGTGAAQVGLVNKGTGEISPVTSGGQAVGAVPAEGSVKTVTQGLNFGQQLKAAEDSFASYVSKKSTGQRMGTSALEQLPFGLKGPADEFIVSYTDPEGSVTAKNLNSVADSLLRLKSGAQINEQEYQRLRTFLPKLGENPVTAQQKFQQFRRELSQTLGVEMRLHPNLFTEDSLNTAGFMRNDLMQLIASGPQEVTIPTSTPSAPAGQVIHMSDVRAKYPNQADQQRIIQKAKAAGIPVVED